MYYIIVRLIENETNIQNKKSFVGLLLEETAFKNIIKMRPLSRSIAFDAKLQSNGNKNENADDVCKSADRRFLKPNKKVKRRPTMLFLKQNFQRVRFAPANYAV